jgi:hypothetical protein
VARYIAEKLKILKDFGIVLNEEQLAHLYLLNNECEIDRYIRPIIIESL